MNMGGVKYDNEALNEFKELIEHEGISKVFFLVDENTHEKCLIPLLQELEFIPENELLEVEAGEESKSAEVLIQLWKAMSELEADRNALVVNVGGGMITDLGGFLAATYMRGLSFVNFPTSVLAQVDASVGGKTGINLDHYKNRIGAFEMPLRTYIINDFLETLPNRERLSGFAEMLKHGLIADADYWRELSSFNINDLLPHTNMIKRSVEIKSSIVDEDFTEQSVRKALNFGHTVGHALETAGLREEEPILHGEAVALGIIAEVFLSVKYCGLDVDKAHQIEEVILKLYNGNKISSDTNLLMEIAKGDKKNFNGEFRLALIKDIGEAQVDIKVSEEDMVNAFNYLQKVLSK